jgi:hypothetical protein
MKELSDEEKSLLYCYTVNPMVPKLISAKIPIINEWKLKWYQPRYQTLKYHEYGGMLHIYKNLELRENLTHIGILHYDVFFNKNSVNDILEELKETPNKIYYIMYRESDKLYFTKEQLKYITEYMSTKLNMNIDVEKVWNEGWISEALSIVPIEIYNTFCEFLDKNHYEIEDFLTSNKWGLMNEVKHRMCGFVERLWGIYLVSCNLQLEKMNIIHDWDRYDHKHIYNRDNDLI